MNRKKTIILTIVFLTFLAVTLTAFTIDPSPSSQLAPDNFTIHQSIEAGNTATSNSNSDDCTFLAWNMGLCANTHSFQKIQITP